MALSPNLHRRAVVTGQLSDCKHTAFPHSTRLFKNGITCNVYIRVHTAEQKCGLWVPGWEGQDLEVGRPHAAVQWGGVVSGGSAVGGGEDPKGPWAACWDLDLILQGKGPGARPEAQA